MCTGKTEVLQNDDIKPPQWRLGAVWQWSYEELSVAIPRKDWTQVQSRICIRCFFHCQFEYYAYHRVITHLWLSVSLIQILLPSLQQRWLIARHAFYYYFSTKLDSSKNTVRHMPCLWSRPLVSQLSNSAKGISSGRGLLYLTYHNNHIEVKCQKLNGIEITDKRFLLNIGQLSNCTDPSSTD